MFMFERDGSAKGIVFSQFTPFLDLIQYSLQKVRYKDIFLLFLSISRPSFKFLSVCNKKEAFHMCVLAVRHQMCSISWIHICFCKRSSSYQIYWGSRLKDIAYELQSWRCFPQSSSCITSKGSIFLLYGYLVVSFLLPARSPVVLFIWYIKNHYLYSSIK